jgi:hypothetical protein
VLVANPPEVCEPHLNWVAVARKFDHYLRRVNYFVARIELLEMVRQQRWLEPLGKLRQLTDELLQLAPNSTSRALITPQTEKRTVIRIPRTKCPPASGRDANP